MDPEDEGLSDIPTILSGAEDEGYPGDGDDERSLTESLTQSMTQSLTQSLDPDSKIVIQENGRVYSNRQGTFLPMDDREKKRHEDVDEFDRALLEYACRKPLLYLSPAQQLHFALDLVTGTGTWAQHLAKQNPLCIVTGVHSAPMQSTFVETNCFFEIDDINNDWTFPEGHYCLVRANNPEFEIRDYTHLGKEAFRVVKRGGYFELSGMDFEIHATSVLTKTPLQKFIEKMVEAGTRVGLDLRAPSKYMQHLTNAGFTNIQEKKILIPFDTVNKIEHMIATINCRLLCDGLEALSLRLFHDAYQQSAEETRDEVLAVQSSLDHSLDRPAVLQHWVRYVVCGQKPM